MSFVSEPPRQLRRNTNKGRDEAKRFVYRVSKAGDSVRK